MPTKSFLDSLFVGIGFALIVSAGWIVFFTAFLPAPSMLPENVWTAANAAFARRLLLAGMAALLWGSRERWSEMFALRGRDDIPQ